MKENRFVVVLLAALFTGVLVGWLYWQGSKASPGSVYVELEALTVAWAIIAGGIAAGAVLMLARLLSPLGDEFDEGE